MQTQQLNIVQIAHQPEWKEMIFDIVRKEKMNPWDIDISGVTSNFMTEVKKKQKLNLKISANVVLAASILLRYKSDFFNLHERRDKELEGAVFIPDEIYIADPIPTLSAQVRITKRKVTLNELITAVEDIISKEKRKATKQQERTKIENIVPKGLLDIVMQSPESFEKELERTFKRIKTDSNGESLSMFSNLIEEGTSEGVIATLLPVLHLANKKVISLWQEDIFGEIFINLLTDKYESERVKEKN